ncbi:UDP-N-acetylmuramate--L-alanine ligase [Candidatus Stoquefichus sp. SB1]|jgi:UDP-N-acetylmuramate--alanine ligase|uniref:UDP-N-acetylmuramate--L-alanine ligase n=1 Tax=Candidatus Stoquefichus sp. SB1 TaxID=1658109 RepID=UPI00067F107B|nr:UDP-N-acetylmuramate--L-alanine ligase [Candidatus Stoquefichus sp. SB1]
MYYFIGIKGSGMASLATILYDLGYEVAGSDIDKYIFIEDELRKRGIPIYSFDKNNIKDDYDVIVGNAFDETNEEVKAAYDNPRVKTHTYYDFLGQLMDQYTSIGIAGTHGKTTTTGMAYHLFKDYDKTSVLIGDGTGHAVEGSHYFIAETCEYQDHFLHYYPTYAVINNIEMDHVDYFHSIEQYQESFEKFANQVKDTVVVWGDDPYLPHLNYTTRVLKFGVGEHNDVKAKNILNNEHGLSFDVYIHGELFGHFALPFYGMHMLYNSLAVITLGYLENMRADYIQQRLSTFDGVKRRYTVKEIGNNIYVDDYAHHPTAIQYVIEATRSRYPGKKIVAIFQPDRFSRGLRFAKEFAASLNLADHPFLVHFPENAKKEPGIDIDIYEIAQYIPRAQVIHEDEEAVKLLAQYDNVVYLFMSSKDIYKLEDNVIAYKESH